MNIINKIRLKLWIWKLERQYKMALFFAGIIFARHGDVTYKLNFKMDLSSENIEQIKLMYCSDTEKLYPYVILGDSKKRELCIYPKKLVMKNGHKKKI